MRRILVGAVTVILGGAVALGVRNTVVEEAGGDAAGVVEETSGAREAPAVGSEGASAVDSSGAAGGPSDSPAAPEAAADDVVAPPAMEVSERAGVGGGERREAAASLATASRREGAAGAAAGPDAAREAPRDVARSAGAAQASGEQDPDARTVLLWASEAYGKVRSLRAEFVQTAENPLLRNRVTSRGTLVQRRPDRFLMRFTEPAGDVIVSDGASIWVYYPSVNEKQVIRAPVGAGGAGGADLQAQFLGDPLTRFTPTLEGTESVGGQRAYVLLLTPRVDTGFRSLKVWVDAQDHLVRRFELVESNGVKRHFELDRLEVDVAAPDSLFRFTPPAGARIVDRG